MFSALDFFAGSGLVRLGLEPEFGTVWANDLCPKKAAVYRSNYPNDTFVLADISDIKGTSLPSAELAWASFPCQDLSLAGNLTGIEKGTRSGLFWQWLRILDEMAKEKRRLPVLIAENVVGFLIANGGLHFKAAYQAIRERGYKAGAVVIDARLFVPQSRPRAFLIAVDNKADLGFLSQSVPSKPFHTDAVLKAADAVDDPEWVWWSLPVPSGRSPKFSDLCDRDAQCESHSKTQELLEMLSPLNRAKLRAAIKTGAFLVGTGYRRTRPDERGMPRQRLELRFDGLAGCLRTPEGGSSRQVVLIVDHGKVRSRLMTVRECARLMGAPDTYELPGSYNDGYRAMGDAVAVPVTRWLTRHLLSPLSEKFRRASAADESAA